MSTMYFSESGQSSGNFSSCSGVQKPITCSTPAPASVENYDLPCCGKILRITLEIHLRFLAV